MTKNKKVEEPTSDQVKAWFEADLKSAHYLLGLVLSDPKILSQFAEIFVKQVAEYNAVGINKHEDG